MVDIIQTEQGQFSQQSKALEQKALDDKEFKFFGDDGFSFWDLVDVVNPLQHIPLVSTVYRDMSGDEIDHGSRLAGGTLFGGPIGLASSALNVILDHNTGKDAGEHVMAWFEGDETDVQPEGNTQFAKNETGTTEPKTYASYASLVPEGEEAAFAAGQNSLRMADLYEFLYNGTAEEVPVEITTASLNNPITTSQMGAGSAGTWAPVAITPTQFQTKNPTDRVISTEQPVTNMTLSEQISQMQTGSAATNYDGFKANQTHLESISALQAFAKDVKAQQMQQVDVQKVEQQMRPQPITTSQLSQTNSEWFANMMNQNYDQYEMQADEDRYVEDVDP